MAKVALITAYNGQGQLLVGKRNDNEKYTLPGGHLEEGEDPEVAALRELHEETGLRAHSLSYLKHYVLANGTELHCYSAFVTGTPHGKNDPDQEVSKWEWIDVEEGLPPSIYENLAGPQDEQNIVTQLFDMKKAENDPLAPAPPAAPAGPPKLKFKAAFRHPETKHVVATGSFHDLGHPDMPTENAHEYESGFVDPTGKFYTRREAAQAINPTNPVYQHYLQLDSANLAGDWRATGDVFRPLSPNGRGREDSPEDLRALNKAQDEVYRLLDHPDPVERSLALKLDSARPEHVLHAALDPDPSVHGPALDNPKFGPQEALQLMEAGADRFGVYPAAQKAALLARPDRIEPYHLTALARAARAAGPAEYAAAAGQIAGHPKASDGLLRSMYLDPNVILDSRMAILGHQATPPDVLNHAVEAGLMFAQGDAGAAAARAAAHANLPLDTLKALVGRAADRSEPHAVTIACTALAGNAGIPTPALAQLFQDLLPRALTQPTSAAPQLLAALLRNPSASPALAGQASKALPPATLQLMLGSPHLQGTDLDTLVVHAHQTKNKDLLSRVMEHPSFGPRHLNLMLAKAEDPLAANSNAPMEKLATHPVINHQLGFEPANHEAFRAAKFLACRAPVTPEAERNALYQEDGDVNRAALLAYGLPATEENLAALAAIVELSDIQKAEPDAPEPQPTAQNVVTAHPEAQDVADGVARAYKDGMVFPVALGGKHSKGSMIAHDPQTKNTVILKSGSGGAGGAAGSKQDPSNPNAREAAFYYVAKDWGIDQWFPRAELLLVDGRPYAALKLLPLDYTTLDYTERKEPGISRRILQPHLYDGDLHKWATLDYVCGNPDRHGQNVMVDPKHDLRLIDHGSAFAGPGFDPAHDKNSFVPYYLRAWALKDQFVQMEAPDKLRALPRVPESCARKLAQWVLSISPEKLQAICVRYGIDPTVTLERLRRVQDGVSNGTPPDLMINQLWSTT